MYGNVVCYIQCSFIHQNTMECPQKVFNIGQYNKLQYIAVEEVHMKKDAIPSAIQNIIRQALGLCINSCALLLHCNGLNAV